ncbi:hypothetical protein ABL78_0079 [Leptomonas seymouri]|uniref:Uncharacterized protein n=1 Tax=Leptomonas seymouri TaxID=5684 RepID=A0A0N0P995_LEPSE|nr:hypothetical protein ABL78_0079 [Leptomonas seymouri]|eukprot:KPI90846.1 hypothetical protein ABL78_0079 [Leptomonas seymouri]
MCPPFADTQLQQEIEERERELLRLYERRDAQTCGQVVLNTSAVAREPRLLYRHAPALCTRKGGPIAPQGGMGTPESITFPLTRENRLLVSEVMHAELIDNIPLAPAVKPEARLSPAPAVPREFTERLRRLNRAVASHNTPSLPEVCISLTCSPIPTRLSSADTSYNGLREPDAGLFKGGSNACCGVNAAGALRHVRFSSQSPQISTFSVERSCNGVVNCEASSPSIRGSFKTTAHGAYEAAAERRGARPAVNDDPPAGVGTPSLLPKWEADECSLLVSAISMMLSPRSSAASYLALIDELRSSLLEFSPSKVGRLPVDVQGSALKVSVKADTVQCPANTAAEEPGAAGPTWEKELTRSRNACRTSAAGETALLPMPSGTRGVAHSGGNPSKASGEESLEDAFASVRMSATPIFLQRPDRRPCATAETVGVRPRRAPASREPQRYPRETAERDGTMVNEENSPSSFSKSRWRSHTQRPAPAKKAPSVLGTRRKKTVHFRASLEHVGREPGACVVPQKRCRRAKRRSPSTCAPTKMPPNMCVEQRGFGADILLACGPTLYFD